MYDKILVPLDGSKLGEAAIPLVNEIVAGAKESRRIEIILLQVVPDARQVFAGEGVAPVPFTAAEQEQIKKSTMVYLDNIGALLKKRPMVTVKALVKYGGDPADQILRASDELNADLIAPYQRMAVQG